MSYSQRIKEYDHISRYTVSQQEKEKYFEQDRVIPLLTIIVHTEMEYFGKRRKSLTEAKADEAG